MHLTPEMLESAYNFLLTTRPFRAWKLPESDDVEFHVDGCFPAYADHTWYANGLHRVRVSRRKHATPLELLASVAHEMVHIHQRRGERISHKKHTAPHGSKFKRLAAQVCKHHGFNPATF